MKCFPPTTCSFASNQARRARIGRTAIVVLCIAGLSACRTSRTARHSVNDLYDRVVERRSDELEIVAVDTAPEQFAHATPSDAYCSTNEPAALRLETLNPSGGSAAIHSTAVSSANFAIETDGVSAFLRAMESETSGSDLELVNATTPLPTPLPISTPRRMMRTSEGLLSPRPVISKQRHLDGVTEVVDVLHVPVVTDYFEDTDIRIALQSIASQADLPIVIDAEVSGLVSCVIEKQPFESALQMVLLPLGHCYVQRDGQYVIGSANPSSQLFSLIAERYDYEANHLPPEELKRSLPPRFQQYVRPIHNSNRLVVEAPHDLCQMIVTELISLDEPVPQVVIETIVCVFSPEKLYQSGLDLRQTGIGRGASGASMNIASLVLSGSLSPAGMSRLFHSFSETSYFLRLMEQEGFVQIRAAPHVMARHGEKAEITIGRETFFSVQPSGTQYLARQDVQKVEAGISLEITPTIQGDNVTVAIDRAEVSEDIRAADTSPAELSKSFPVINRRTVSTTVHVGDGETIVIGGLTQQQTVDRKSWIPRLGTNKYIGRLFQSIDRQQHDTEIVIFLSPRIVRHNVEHPSAQPISLRSSVPMRSIDTPQPTLPLP